MQVLWFASIGRMLFAFVFALAIGLLIGAIILRTAVALYNKMAGGASSPSSVPEPAIGKAMGITFVTSLVQTVVGFLIGLVTGAEAAGADGSGVDVVAQLISFPFSLLILAAMLSAMLPTTFGRALLVALCYMLVIILIVGIAILIVGILVVLTFIGTSVLDARALSGLESSALASTSPSTSFSFQDQTEVFVLSQRRISRLQTSYSSDSMMSYL